MKRIRKTLKKMNRKRHRKTVHFQLPDADKDASTDKDASVDKDSSIHSLNCNPAVSRKISGYKSCYVPAVLFKIKEEYNKDHPAEQHITTDDPAKIWKELLVKLNSCEEEKCWLREIDDRELRTKIEKHAFAPEQPEDWKQNPNQWLSNYDILDVLEQYEETYPEFEFIGPATIDFDMRLKSRNYKCVLDELCEFSLEKQIKNKKSKIAMVFNLDKHDESGSHWVSLFIDLDSRIIFFMDSAGNKIPREINVFVNRVKQQGAQLSAPIRFAFHQNHPMNHQYGSSECGMYSLYFIITMLTRETEEKSNMSIKELVHLFKHERITDAYVEKYRNKYFNISP